MRMCYQISKEDYEKAVKNGPETIIGKVGYLYKFVTVEEIAGKYYLMFERLF